MDYDTSDNAVTSVVGEILILVLVIILVSLFATFMFNLPPGDREMVTTISMENNTTHLIFWHKGGDCGSSRTADSWKRDVKILFFRFRPFPADLLAGSIDSVMIQPLHDSFYMAAVTNYKRRDVINAEPEKCRGKRC